MKTFNKACFQKYTQGIGRKAKNNDSNKRSVSRTQEKQADREHFLETGSVQGAWDTGVTLPQGRGINAPTFSLLATSGPARETVEEQGPVGWSSSSAPGSGYRVERAGGQI